MYGDHAVSRDRSRSDWRRLRQELASGFRVVYRAAVDFLSGRDADGDLEVDGRLTAAWDERRRAFHDRST
jgi:hypothetical protein